MTQKTIKVFMKESYSKPAENNYATNKANVYHNVDIWSVDIWDPKDYGPENNRNYRYVLVIIESHIDSKYEIIDNLKERINEALLKKTELTLKKFDSALKIIKFDLNRTFVVPPNLC